MTALIKFPSIIEEKNSALLRREGELGHYSIALDTICCDYYREDLDGDVIDAHVTVCAKDLT